MAKQFIKNSRRDEHRTQYTPTNPKPVQMMEFQKVKPKESKCRRSLLPTEVNIRSRGYAMMSRELTMTYQLMKKAGSGALENFIIYYNMLANKYTYARNHGLLPEAPPVYSPSVTSYGLLTTSSQFEVKANYQKTAFVIHNEQEYLHRRCSHVFRVEEVQRVIQNIGAAYPFQDQSLGVFVAAQPKQSQLIILGIQSRKSLLGLAYEKLLAVKRPRTKIVLSVMGIRDENNLTDQLFSQQQGNSMEPYKKRIKVVKYKNAKSYSAENITQSTIDSKQELFQLLQQYLRTKSDSELTRAGQENWDWLEGELFHLAEVQYDAEDRRVIEIVKSHYLLKVNQYLGSTSSLMLKLGMRLRMMQRPLQFGVNCKQSNLFQLLGECFGRSSRFKVHLFLQIGHSPTINQQYLNLVPTSSIQAKNESQQIDSHFEQISFLYLKHYPDYEPVLELVSKIQNENNQNKPHSSSVAMSAAGSELPNKVKKRRTKSYVNDTVSSMEKRRPIRMTVFNLEQQQQNQAQNIEDLIKQTAKQYRRSEQSISKEPAFRLTHLSLLRKPKQKQQRKHLFDWQISERSGRKQKRGKIYSSQNQASGSRLEMGSTRNGQSKWLKTVYGCNIVSAIRQDRQRTKDVVNQLVKKQIFQMGQQDEMFPEDYEYL